MTEYIGYKDPVGDGMCNMGITDEEVIRCRDCGKSSSVTAQGEPCPDGKLDCCHFAQWDYYDDKPGVCLVEPDGYCAWAVRRS